MSTPNRGMHHAMRTDAFEYSPKHTFYLPPMTDTSNKTATNAVRQVCSNSYGTYSPSRGQQGCIDPERVESLILRGIETEISCYSYNIFAISNPATIYFRGVLLWDLDLRNDMSKARLQRKNLHTVRRTVPYKISHGVSWAFSIFPYTHILQSIDWKTHTRTQTQAHVGKMNTFSERTRLQHPDMMEIHRIRLRSVGFKTLLFNPQNILQLA